MFLKKLFGKDCRHYLERGKKYFEEERYADARHAFEEALQKIGDEGENSGTVKTEILGYLCETGNRLGLLNIAEAEHAAAQGDLAKAEEHVLLALELAEDQSIREKAERLRGWQVPQAAPAPHKHGHHNCSGCGTETVAAPEHDQFTADHLSAQERFELLVHPLPGDLPQRYAAMGEKFAQGYLLVHEGKENEGGKIFQELLAREESDILLYEIALINYRNGHLTDSEQQLRRVIAINDANPLGHLALVQLLVDTGRLAECVPLLNRMIDRQLLVDQALMYLGDIYLNLGNEQEAMESYSKALTHPSAAKAAAERLVTLLQKQERLEEAAFLAKRYLKGCC
jgi:tetratricopeptide (TPR) repeat protein